MRYLCITRGDIKNLISSNYNYIFNKKDGKFARWGELLADDPQFSPFGPELLDIELSTICHGVGKPCSFCYKSNTPKGENMTLSTFKRILLKVTGGRENIPLTQIAFGIGDIDANPDLWDIMQHTRDQGFIPNITINGARMTTEAFYNLTHICGAVAVSNYDKELCYNTVEKLDMLKDKSRQSTLQQVNIHQLLCEETLPVCMELLEDMQRDERLRGLNAVVFLLLKPKGKRNKYHQLKDAEKYGELISYALDNSLPIGFDSCTASSFLRAIEGRPEEEALKMCAEPCESTCFSLYINSRGETVPCSFAEDEDGIEPINILNVNNFQREVWYAPQTVNFRNKLLKSHEEKGSRECPIWDVEIKGQE